MTKTIVTNLCMPISFKTSIFNFFSSSSLSLFFPNTVSKNSDRVICCSSPVPSGRSWRFKLYIVKKVLWYCFKGSRICLITLCVVPSQDALLHSSILKLSLSTYGSQLNGTHTPVLSCIWPLTAAGYKIADKINRSWELSIKSTVSYIISFLSLTQLAGL